MPVPGPEVPHDRARAGYGGRRPPRPGRAGDPGACRLCRAAASAAREVDRARLVMLTSSSSACLVRHRGCDPSQFTAGRLAQNRGDWLACTPARTDDRHTPPPTFVRATVTFWSRSLPYGHSDHHRGSRFKRPARSRRSTGRTAIGCGGRCTRSPATRTSPPTPLPRPLPRRCAGDRRSGRRAAGSGAPPSGWPRAT